MDFDWKTMLDGALETWRAMAPAKKEKLWILAELVSGLVAILVPIALATWATRSGRRKSKFSGNKIVNMPAAQAIDLWYQESRRYLDGRATTIKLIGTGAGLGLAAAGTVLAIAEESRRLLYLGVSLEFLALLTCVTAQFSSTWIYREQANELSRKAIGAEPDDIVAVELFQPRNAQFNRVERMGHLMAMAWMSFGWLFILLAVARMARA